MTSTFVLVCLAVGVGTYLFRYLPSRLRPSDRPSGGMRGPLGVFLGSVGVAAVAALLAASLEPSFAPLAAGAGVVTAGCAVAALTVTGLAFRWRKDVAVSTLAGAVVYGLGYWLLGLG